MDGAFAPTHVVLVHDVVVGERERVDEFDADRGGHHVDFVPVEARERVVVV